MVDLSKLSDEELMKMANIKSNDTQEKKGLFKRLFGKKNKMAKETEQTNLDNNKATENVENVKTSEQTLKDEIKKVIEEEPTQEQIEENVVEDVEEQIEENVEEIAVPVDMVNVIEKENLEKIVEEKEKMVENKVIEKADFKLATFTIKVTNKNVGKVLTKIGEYASELDGMEEVEHCDLNIIDSK